MTGYLMLKWLHILSSVLLVGTGFGSAFYLYFILRTRNIQAIATVSRYVVKADWWFTTPAVVMQPLTGFAMISIAGMPLSQTWLGLTLALYIIAGLCWLPVVWLQIRLRDLAATAQETGTGLPEPFWRYARFWVWLGYPAFAAMLAIYGLMVFKPA